MIGESGRERERTKCLWAVIRNQAILSTKIERVKSPKFFVAKKKVVGCLPIRFREEISLRRIFDKCARSWTF